MKAKTFILLLMLSCGTIQAQFACDPSSSMENSMLEKKVTLFEDDCMQYAVNVSTNVNRNRMVGIMDEKGRQTSTPHLQIIPLLNTANKAWQVKLTEWYSWEHAAPGATIKVYSRPGMLENEGKKITMTLYTLEVDTLLIQPNLEEVMHKVRKDNDKYEELTISVAKHYENGAQYARLTGVFTIPEKGLKPSKLGDVVAYFYTNLCYNYIYQLKNEEVKTKDELPKTSLGYWNKSQFGSVLKANDLYKKQEGIPEGRYNWSENDGRKVLQVDNFGKYILVYFRVDNTTKGNRDAALKRMGDWLDKNRHKDIETAEVKMFGETPWMEMKINISGLNGKQIYGDVYEKIIQKWGDTFLKEVAKATK